MNGYALHIGINYCNPQDLADCQLDGAIPDARALMNVTERAGFSNIAGRSILTGDEATREGITDALTLAAKAPADGDLLIVTFNGLGIAPDLANDADTVRMNRGWVTNDGEVLRVHEFLGTLSRAKAGARILVVSSCCFIGPNLGNNIAALAQFTRRSRAISSRFLRSITPPPIVSAAALAARPAASGKPRIDARAPIGDAGPATVYHLCASGINEPVSDGTAAQRSPFVRELLGLLIDPQRRSFAELLDTLRDRLDPEPQLEKLANQSPEFDVAGPYIWPDDPRGGFGSEESGVSVERKTA